MTEDTILTRASRVWAGERAQMVALELRRVTPPGRRPYWALVVMCRDGESRREIYDTRREAVAAMRSEGPW
jgi:hypothetical protein